VSRLAPVLAREGLPLPSKLRSRRWTGQSAPLLLGDVNGAVE